MRLWCSKWRGVWSLDLGPILTNILEISLKSPKSNFLVHCHKNDIKVHKKWQSLEKNAMKDMIERDRQIQQNFRCTFHQNGWKDWSGRLKSIVSLLFWIVQSENGGMWTLWKMYGYWAPTLGNGRRRVVAWEAIIGVLHKRRKSGAATHWRKAAMCRRKSATHRWPSLSPFA